MYEDNAQYSGMIPLSCVHEVYVNASAPWYNSNQTRTSIFPLGVTLASLRTHALTLLHTHTDMGMHERKQAHGTRMRYQEPVHASASLSARLSLSLDVHLSMSF